LFLLAVIRESYIDFDSGFIDDFTKAKLKIGHELFLKRVFSGNTYAKYLSRSLRYQLIYDTTKGYQAVISIRYTHA
jgi:hypothetical protein